MAFGKDSVLLQGEMVLLMCFSLTISAMFEDNITLYASLPFSQVRRIEATASASWYYYRIDRFKFITIC